jgi:hypothetical protein
MSFTTDTPVLPFADLSAQWLEASTRAISASADLYTEVLRTQADATTALLDAYTATGVQTAARGSEAVEVADEAATKAVRGTARAAKRATKRTASATRKATAAPRRAAAATEKAAVEAPIAGYDDLTAEEITGKLPELSQVQLAAVTAYERANGKRATVLDRAKALTGAEPVPGYDELTADEVQKLLTGADAETAAKVRDYERRHKDRSSVVEPAVRNADAS